MDYSVRYLPWSGPFVSREFQSEAAAQRFVGRLKTGRKAYAGRVYHAGTEIDSFKEVCAGVFEEQEAAR